MVNRLLSLILIIISVSLNAQISINNTLTPEQLVQDVLIGQGVVPTNIRVNGSAALANSLQFQAAEFNSGNSNFDIPYGVLLTTGRTSVAVGPNNDTGANDESQTLFLGSTDPDMVAISSGSRHNGIVLEFDFVATGEILEFNYIFASEEYPEFSNSEYNDAFGFFLSGPGINGSFSNNGINLAQVPNLNIPVTINNVNQLVNSQYYRNNVNGAAYGTAIEYDGTTVVLTARAELVCGETYKIKFGIVNIGDEMYDSGVFLQGGSFSVTPVAFNFNTFTEDNNIYEGCNQPVELSFSRDGCADDTQPLSAYLTYGGQAQNGIDYALLPDSVYFAPGVNTVTLYLEPIEDNIVEGAEAIEITILTYDASENPIYNYATIMIHDVPEFRTGVVDTTIFCFRDSLLVGANPDGLFPPFQYAWEGYDTTQYIIVNLDSNGLYRYPVTITDFCGYIVKDTLDITILKTIMIDSFRMTPANCNPIGTLMPYTYPFGGHIQDPNYPNSYSFTFDWTYLQDTTWVLPNQMTLENLPGGWYKLELTDNVVECMYMDSVLVEVVDVPFAIINAVPGAGCAPLTVLFENASVSANSFVWDMGDGVLIPTNSSAGRQEVYDYTTTVMLVASNGDPLCNDTSYVTVEIVTCGCTDPQALNYSISAIMDDGSCVYPSPTGWAPNVITLNGDGIHDYFYITTEYAASTELTILNRWGGIVFDGTGDQLNPPKWNGVLPGGAEASEGVYFYKYKVTGPMGDEIEGHGFLTIVR